VKAEQSLSEHLERTAHDLVLQFTAFELMHDYAALTAMGSGTLWIDLASGQTHHDGRKMPPLVVTGILQAWLRQSLAAVHTSKTGTQDAALTAELTIEHYNGQRHEGRWPGAPGRFVECRADIRCRLVVDGQVGEARSEELMEWPEEGAA